jgi:hypothetical protein
MANRIAVNADTIATITNTSASSANRIADFILRPFVVRPPRTNASREATWQKL